MLKVHYQTDQEDLLKACGGVMFQLFEDRFVKSAASDTFTREALRDCAPDKDHFMLHLVAMGDHEGYGPNKNGDTFPKAALEKYAHTFVSNGCFFREHRNRDQKTQGIGHVKAAAYSPDMHRVELIVHGHKEKAAAEYEKAKNGEPLSFSMSARVPWDRCSVCDHQAKKQADYCGHLKEGMLKYHDDFRKYAYAINDHPTFFDISVVAKPADRIAHYLEYAFDNEDDRVKAASDKRVITGVEWAEYEGLAIPDKSDWAWDKRNALLKVANMQQTMDGVKSASCNSDPLTYFASNVAPYAWGEQLSDEAVDALRGVEVGELCKEMAKRAAVLPFPEFAAWVTGKSRSTIMDDPTVKAAAAMLPMLLDSLIAGGPSSLDGMFDSCCGCGGVEDDVVQKFMDDVERKFSVKTEPAKGRIIQIITIKAASEIAPSINKSDLSQEQIAQAQALAEAYHTYKAAAICDIARIHDMDDMQYALLAAQNKFISH